jgi:hypothetical protein
MVIQAAVWSIENGAGVGVLLNLPHDFGGKPRVQEVWEIWIRRVCERRPYRYPEGFPVEEVAAVDFVEFAVPFGGDFEFGAFPVGEVAEIVFGRG